MKIINVVSLRGALPAGRQGIATKQSFKVASSLDGFDKLTAGRLRICPEQAKARRRAARKALAMTRFMLLAMTLMILFFFQAQAQTLPPDTDWFTLGANYQRSSWVREEVRGPFSAEWYRPIDPYIDNAVQVIATNDTIFVSTTKGLYAFDPANGDQKWVYGTEMPLTNSPTVVTVNGRLTVYVGGYDRRIHAIDANTGQAVSGYTPYEAGAGFTTNPLVVNGTIYIGNRDGYFYAFNASDGSLRWRFKTDGPINYNAAYKDGVVYIASDDMYAYALNTSDGSQAWKSGKFPGVGFDMYWPVIYTEPVSGKDYVVYSGSLKDTQMIGGNLLNHAQANYELYRVYDTTNPWPTTCNGFSRDPICLAGPTGNEPYTWVAGTSTVRADAIYNYYNNNPTRWNGQPPYLRVNYILDRGTGTEVTPYAPFNPSQSDGDAQGYKHPPIVGSDGVLYTAIGYYGRGNGGCHGGISGWKFGTPYISRLYDHDSGACDEPETISAGGNIIYVGEGVNALIHGTFGAVEYSKPMGSNATWGVNFNSSAPGATTKYTNISLQGKFGGNSGVYTYFDGVLNHTLIPYKGKIYVIIGNVLYAFSATGRATTPLPTVQAPSNPVSFSVSDTSSTLQQRLEEEVQKMVNAGHLRPGFMDSGQQTQFMVGAYQNPVPNEHMVEYFHNPAETVAVLSKTLPYLSSGLQDLVKTYLRTNYGPGATYDLTRIVNVGWKNGAKRETFDDTPDMTAHFNKSYQANDWAAGDPRTFSMLSRNLLINTNDSGQWYEGGMTVDSFYGAWKYAEIFPQSALTIFNAMKDHLSVADQAGVNNDMTDANLIKYPWLLNEYIIGYYGYLQLEKLAGATSDITQSSKYAEYNRLLNLRLNNFTKDPPWDGTSYNHNNDLNAVRNFIYLTPELAEIFRTTKLADVQATLDQYDVLTPFWFVSKYHRSYSESYYQPLMDYGYLFQARALISKPTFSELVKYLDIPAFARGDLYYIQNLVAALSAAPATPGLRGDVNFDSQVNVLDIQACVNHILGIQNLGNSADVNQDGSVDVLDVQVIVNIILGV